MAPIHLVGIICIVGFTAVSAVIDWRYKRLPNYFTVPVFVAGLIYHAVAGGIGGGLSGVGTGLLASLGGFAVGFSVLLILWLIGGGGGGDVKFMGALGAWLGPTLTLLVLFIAMVVIVIASIGMLAFETIRLGFGGAQKRYLRFGANKETAKAKGKGKAGGKSSAVKRRLLPFAVPVTVATWCTLIIAQVWTIPPLSAFFRGR